MVALATGETRLGLVKLRASLSSLRTGGGVGRQPVAAALALVKLPRKKSGQKKKSNRMLGKREPDVPHASVEFDRV